MTVHPDSNPNQRGRFDAACDIGPLLLDAPLGSPSRPTWRGGLHLIALCTAVPLLVVLAVESASVRARAAVIVYAVGLCSMLAVSTTYHRWVHTIRARAAWRRADHATIFAAIAGTFSALALTSLDTGAAIAMLAVVWVASAVGAGFQVFSFHRANRLGVAMYIALGWAGVALVPAVWQRGGALAVGLMLGGGALYTIGAGGVRMSVANPTSGDVLVSRRLACLHDHGGRPAFRRRLDRRDVTAVHNQRPSHGDLMNDTAVTTTTTTTDATTDPDRQCARCRLRFAVEPGTHPMELIGWWTCEHCTATLLPGGAARRRRPRCGRATIMIRPTTTAAPLVRYRAGADTVG